ncbi:hypothetical protein C2869_01060 [Saccharobesus litoralis]|uniref:Uncharacterized protein n=1 Tax=Saccharobesus litoralis TaxID=2172099 RepID=A0A2S0VLP8_9ALTE|nr:hypothetical protein [Saccharobesus litoralis]AWB65115.1 hypothetical protein C2869_01060 [Saccharobesus litoralis]
MPCQLKRTIGCLLLSLLLFVTTQTVQATQTVDNKSDIEFKEPLYKPFIERYVLDELKQLRVEQAQTKQELTEKMVEREHRSVDRAVSYATDTITYFFYLIAACTSILVLVGWNSLRDIKERVHSLADEELRKLIAEYENRLADIEKQLKQKSKSITENKEEIELTQEVQTLWLRSQREATPNSKISVYDEILQLKPDDAEALTYKADAVLELGEPQWACNLCLQALAIEPDDAHAHFQLACAYALLDLKDESLANLEKAVSLADSYRQEITTERAFNNLRDTGQFKALIANISN